MTLSPQKLEIYGIPSIHLPNNYIHGFCLDRPLYPHVLLNLKWNFGSRKKKIRKSSDIQNNTFLIQLLEQAIYIELYVMILVYTVVYPFNKMEWQLNFVWINQIVLFHTRLSPSSYVKYSTTFEYLEIGK